MRRWPNEKQKKTKRRSPNKGSFSLQEVATVSPEYAIDRIIWFTQLPEFQINGFWTKAELEEKSYVRWTAYELLNEIMGDPATPVSDILDAMWFQTLYYYHSSKTPRAKKQFEAALNTLDTIYALL